MDEPKLFRPVAPPNIFPATYGNASYRPGEDYPLDVLSLAFVIYQLPKPEKDR